MPPACEGSEPASSLDRLGDPLTSPERAEVAIAGGRVRSDRPLVPSIHQMKHRTARNGVAGLDSRLHRPRALMTREKGRMIADGVRGEGPHRRGHELRGVSGYAQINHAAAHHPL